MVYFEVIIPGNLFVALWISLCSLEVLEPTKPIIKTSQLFVNHSSQPNHNLFILKHKIGTKLICINITE